MFRQARKAPASLRSESFLDGGREAATLDLRAGTLEREVLWRAASGALVRVRSNRLVSLTQCSVCAIRYEVAVLEGSARVLVRSGLVVNETPPEIENDDPRVGATLDAPFHSTGSMRWPLGGRGFRLDHRRRSMPEAAPERGRFG